MYFFVHSSCIFLDASRQRERSIKFGSSKLCTISEEDYEYPYESSSMKLLHDGTYSHIAGSRPKVISRTSWDRSRSGVSTAGYPRSLTPTSPHHSYSSRSPSLHGSKYSVQPSSGRSISICNPHISNEQIETSVEHQEDVTTPRLEDFIYMDCCMKQTCGDCPKKRYYAKFLAQHDRRTNLDGRQEEDQCDYLYCNENRRCCSHGKTNAVNIISFLVFIVMFYGIFQYIDAGVRNGKFPWI